jgi:hypothetical protein
MGGVGDIGGRTLVTETTLQGWWVVASRSRIKMDVCLEIGHEIFKWMR